MKRILTILFLFTCAHGLFAQRPDATFVEEGKVWETYISEKGPLASWKGADCIKTYYIKGDTIVGNHACKKVYTFERFLTVPTRLTPTSLYACLYEEAGRVYLIAPNSETPGLLYDFGMQVGETATFRLVDYRNAQNAVNATLTMTDKWEGEGLVIGHQIAGRKTPVITLIRDNGTDLVFWVERVGDVCGPFSTWLTTYKPQEVPATWDLPSSMRCIVNGEPLYGWFENYEVGIDRISTGTQAVDDGAIYDLSGRRLAEAPKQGIYIQGRKKRIAR